ncbi:MAG: spermidine/putrescine ABC transporter substrate-binding protein [Acidimicrobiaceae bacterium]|nr:spermidine/putrescine ABC transporter substrate-binding protein [Acidimicrobiaceae bacterium]MCO5328997.1 spermidine/putrescine ABC transporter substrate-binding protein [Ilumatobacteraceae bacterium]
MQGSRRQFITRSAQLGLLLGGGVPLLQACGDDDSSSGGEKAGPIADGLEPEAGPLRILNYADYVSPDVIAAFEDQYGVKVEITTFDTDTEAITKLASGAIKADVHHSMAIYSVANLVAGGILQPLNKTYIPNAANILSSFDDPWYDPGAAYSLPYTYFGTGIGYRADRITAEEVDAQGWDTIWNATGFKGEVSVLDDEREAFTMAMLRRGITDINTDDQATIDQALADLSELIDLVNIKVNIEGYKDIPEGTTTIAQTWSGDLITGANNYLPEGTDASVLGFWHPPAGQYVLTNDAMGVIAGAEHPVLAHLYLNFILDNDIAEENFGWVGYLPAIKKLDADYLIDAGWVPENLRNCVPTQEELDKALYIKSLGVDGDAKWAEAWSTFNAGG